MASFDELYAQAKAARPDAPDDILRAAAEMQLAEDQQISSGDFLGAVPNEAAMRANMGDPGAGSSEPSWNETFTVKRFDPLAAAMEAMGATMPSKKPVKGTPLEAALAAMREDPAAPATQNSLLVEIGRQGVAGYGDAAKMINQAGEFFSPSGSAAKEFFRQGKEYWNKYGTSGVTAPFVDTPGSAKEWEPQLDGRSLPGEILIKGARAFVPSVAGIGAATMNPLVGGAAIFSLFGGSQAQETWDKGIKLVQEGKLSEDDLLKASLINMVIEGGGETIADMLGAKFILNPLAATLKDVAKKDGLKAAIELAKNPAWVKDFAKGAIANAAVQSGTEYGQNYGETSVENAYGISKENPHEQGVEGFKGGLGLSTLLLPVGAVSSRRAGKNRQLAGDILSSPDATQEQKQSAAGYMLHELEQRGVKTTTEDILKATSVDGAINAANASLEATGSLEQSLDAFKNPATLGDQQALPNYAGPPLVIFSDGSTMTQAEAQQRNALGPMPAPATPDNSTLTAAAKTSNEANLAAVQSEEQGLRATSPVKTISGIPAAEHTDQSLADLIANPDTNHITRNAAIAEQNNRLASAAPTQEGTGGTNAITATLGGTTVDVTPAPTPKTNTVAEAAKILSTPAEQRVPADQMKLRNVAQRIGDAAFAQLEQYVKGRALLTRDQRVSVEKLIASDGKIAPAAKAEVPTLPAPATQQALADNEEGQFSQQRVTELFGPGAQFREASSPDVRGERVGSVMRKFLTQMGRLTGTQVIFFNDSTRADGVTRDGNTVFINTTARINPLQVLGHETTHILKKKHYDAWKAIRDAVEAGLGTDKSAALLKFAENYWSAPQNKEKLAKLQADTSLLDSDAKEFGIATNEKTVADFLMDEMIADMGGEQWSDPAFWDGVFKRIEAQHGSEKAKGIISRLVAAVKEAINKFLMLAKMPGFGTTEKLNLDPEHLKAIRSAIEAAYAEFISAERRNEPAGYAAEREKLETLRANPKQEKPVDETNLEGQQFPDVQETPKRAEFKDQTLPTRWPTAAGLTPSVDDSMITDLATLKQNEKQYAKAVAAILEEPGMHSKDIVTGTLDEKADHVIERLKTNLLWLFDQIPAAIRERSKLWYDGARRIAEVWAERYDISNSQAAGMLAVLSPQKDWFMNVTMAERVLDIIHTKMDHKFDERMDAAAFSMLTKDSLKDDPDARKNLNAYEAVKNKTLRQVAKHHNLREMSVWIRAYDEAYHDAKHAIVTPEGGFVEDKLTVKGEPTLRAWGDFTTPGKAASIYLDGTPENINKMLGGEHKVRNFYNNIYAPGDNRFVTIDTHAVAADMLRALAGADKPVAENFGKTGGTNLTGLSGTYALHYEAYQRAAQERGVLPREMQSITWEAVRGLFTEGFKGKKDNVADIDQIWRKVDAGELTADQARSEILERAGGITNPDWWQEGNAEYKAVLRDKTYNQERQPFRGARMVFEIAPDPRNRALKARWDNLSPEAQAEISHKVAWKIVAKALASFGDENMKGELHTQLGGWLDDTNPSLAIWFNKRAAASKIGDLVRIVGYALNQMGMMRTSPRPFKKPDGTKADRMGAIQIKLGKNLSRDEIHSIYADLRTAITGKRGKRLINGHSTADGVMIILNDGKLISDEALTQRIGDRLFGKYDVQLDEIYADFPAKGKDNYGLRSEAGKDSRLGAEPSLRARADQLRAESGLLLDQLIGERERGIQSSERRSDATGDRSDRAGVASEDRASYGRAVDRHSVSVTGVHYSQQERQELSSAFFGSGLKGQERLRISYADDPRIKRRLYFYANTGKGINPEAGVGSHAHSVDLNNVYDMDVDPLKLYQHSDNGQYRSVDQKMNDFESAVLDAGYDGYLTRDFGTGGAVVLLGDHTVPVKYEGAGTRPDVGTIPAPKYDDLQKLKQKIAENRSLPNGQMTGLEWKRTMLREMPEVDPRWLENDKLYYKDQLLSGADGAAISHSEARDLQSDHEVQNEIQGDRAIDPDRLKALRRDAARIERPMAGISLRITDDGRAIATGPKGARVPDTFRKFAAENGLRFMAQRKLPEPSDWTNDIGDQYSPAMPIEYRESGAMYFNEMGSAFLDRTDKTRFSEYRAVDTESAEFKKWFKGSAVVDADGKPLVVYHGTIHDFSSFNAGQYSGLIFLTPSKEFANDFAARYQTALAKGEPFDPNVMPVYVSASNIFDFRNPRHVRELVSELKSRGIKFNATGIGRGDWDALELSGRPKVMQELGFDGLYIKEHGLINIAVFSPTQIKSAVSNTGEFDSTNPDIRFTEKRRSDVFTREERRLTKDLRSKAITEEQWMDGMRNAVRKFIDEVGANLGDRESAAEMFSRLGINENSKYGGYYELRKHILDWNTAIKMGPTYQNWAHMVHGFASAESTDATIRYIKHQPYAPTTMQSTRERLVAVAKTLGWVVNKPSAAAPEVAGLLESTQRIVGDSGRQYDPDQKALFQRTGREVTDKSVLERLNTWVAKSWKQGLFDQFAPFRGTRAYILMRLSKGAAGALEAFMRHGKLFLRDGATDADTSGGVIKNVFVPLGKETTDFLYWIAGNRAERLAMEGKERLFTTADIAAAKSLANGTTDFDYTLANGQVTRDRTLIYRDSLKKFNEYNKNVMDLAEASGLIDGQARHLWEHEFYVPFYRVMEDDTMRGMGIKKGIVRQEAFKKLKGGEEKMGDLLSNTLANWAHLIDASAKNRAAKAAVETAVQMGVARPAVTGEKETVWYMDGGKKQTYRISDKGVMEAIIGLEYAGMKNLVMDVLTKPKHWLTMGVTASPFFKVRNLIRDSVQAIATSDLSYNAIGNVYQGFKLTDRDRQEYVSALAGGGLIRLGTMLEGNEVARTRQLIKQGSKDSHILSGETALRKFYDKALEPALEWYNELGNRGEEINRMSLYDQMIKSGMDHAEASLMARDLMDFSLQGSFTTIRFLAQVVPFFNARVQGLYKLGRASQENSAHMAVVTFMATLAGLGLMALAARDDDEWKRWKNRPESDKQNYWYFTLGGKEYRIPRPFELGAVAFVGERTVEAMIDNERDAGKRLAKSILDTAKNQLSMNPTPQAVKPILDIYSNRDSFRDTPIESMSMQRLEPTHRYTGQTSMPARWMSEATAGYLSPVQYDHLVQSYFGWMGAMAVSTADEAYRAINNSEPKRAEKDLWKLATGGMVREDPVASRYVSQMYDQAKELEQAHATHNQLRKEGKVAEATEFRDENIDKLKAYRSVEAVKKQESLISERIRMIERSEIHPAEKRIKIRELRERQAEIAARLAQ